MFQGLFSIPELTDHTGFALLENKVTDEIESLIKEATSPSRDRKIVEIFDELSDCVCRVADMVSFYVTTFSVKNI